MLEKYYVGFKHGKAVSSEKVKEQIKQLGDKDLDIYAGSGEEIEWKDINDPKEKRTIFQAIVQDRKKRVDKNVLMSGRPPLAIATVENDKIVRLEYYEGHDKLNLVYDVRSKSLSNKELKPSLQQKRKKSEKVS